jgi:hypothetical protein
MDHCMTQGTCRMAQGVGGLCSRSVYTEGGGVTVDTSLEQGLSSPL